MQHEIVPQDEWLKARKDLLAKEKEFTKARDALSAARRALPWTPVKKNYVFDGPNGKETLSDLFGGKSQLMIYHFMLGPGWVQGCPSCSFLADHFDGAVVHLAQRDVAFVVVSRAPFAEIEAYKKRMGWKFRWVSSDGSDFNYDYHVSFTKDQLAQGKVYYNYEMTEGFDELPGVSVFYKDSKNEIFHTYSTYGRGGDILIGAYNYLDLTPKGRNESTIMDWMRRHDEYENAGQAAACCGSAQRPNAA